MVEVLEEFKHFNIGTNKELRLLLKKHRKQIISIDRTPFDKVHQGIYQEMIGKDEYRDSVQHQYWFCYPALARMAMEIEFGEKYEKFANQRDGI